MGARGAESLGVARAEGSGVAVSEKLKIDGDRFIPVLFFAMMSVLAIVWKLGKIADTLQQIAEKMP